MAAVSIVALSAVMYGCVHSGDGDDNASTDMTDMQPTPYETAKAAIMAADTAAAAQAAYDAVKDDVTAAEGEKLQMAVDARVAALAKMGRVDDQKMALMDAAGDIDTSDEALSTQEGVDAARTAIATLRGAIAAAVDVDDTSMYQTILSNAVTAVDEAQDGIDTDMRRSNQMMALSDASGELQTALAALSGSTPTQAQLDAANAALTKLNNALTGAMDLSDTEKAPYQREANNAPGSINMAQTAKDKADADKNKADNAAMMATAMKLHTGISAPGGTGTTTRTGAYGAGDNANDIAVTIGVANAVNLSEDKKTMVADLHDWEGKRYTHTVPSDATTGAGDTYEAIVYSNVGDPTPGKKFGGVAANDEFEYALTNGMITVDTAQDGVSGRVDSPDFDQSAGTKEFPKPTNNLAVMISGSYHGVSGTYSCTPTTGNTCATQLAAEGFLLGITADNTNVFSGSATAWTFKPSDPNARVTEMPDEIYASYGWWLRKSADGKMYTASAFAADKGNVADATGIDTLRGTATYMGGAVGKYALYSALGETNDAGHFTAIATLEADFNDDMIMGTIDRFMGADGESRDWSVELKKSGVNGTGTIIGTDGTGTEQMMTVWTIGDEAAAAAGGWQGSLQDNGDDGVPKVATGTFYSEYGTAGKMVGAFGANKEE